MALRAGYYGIKRGLKDKLAEIVGTWDQVKNEVDKVLPDGIIANTGLIKDTVGWSGKNKLQSKLASNTLNGITFTRNSDDTWTVSGTATSDAWMNISGAFKLPEGKYIMNGCPKNGGASSYRLYIKEDPSGGFSVNDYGNDVEFTITSALAQKNLVVFIAVMHGTAITTPIVFKPMIRPADILDGTYEQYSDSTVETILTDHKTTINAIITAATGAADFAAFKTSMGAITPVTRSLSLTKEDMTEEVKEDVEPEKTVTKKRTTKKTEEV